jgi:NAD(P)-dependent dehydrogenase (short-subunit alcohol dehydrogenase family)
MGREPLVFCILSPVFLTMSRLVLVTGAAGGVGSSIVAKFCALGDTVLANDVSDERLTKLDRVDGRLIKVVADITDGAGFREAVTNAAQGLGPVDVVVANAGGASSPTLRKTTIDSWRRDIELNLHGTMHTVEAVREGMMTKRKGAIVAISSVNALLTLGHPAYSAAKAGLISYVKALATELGKYGIRANAILPGTVRTPIWQQRVEKNPTIFEQLRKWYPLGRVVEPEDVAEAVIFLASDAAKAITGVALPVDCGLTAGNLPLASELTVEEW